MARTRSRKAVPKIRNRRNQKLKFNSNEKRNLHKRASPVEKSSKEDNLYLQNTKKTIITPEPIPCNKSNPSQIESTNRIGQNQQSSKSKKDTKQKKNTAKLNVNLRKPVSPSTNKANRKIMQNEQPKSNANTVGAPLNKKLKKSPKSKPDKEEKSPVAVKQPDKISLTKKEELNKMIYQFKVVLLGTRVWRRFQIEAHSTFADLFWAIAGSIGWMGHNLHHFEIINPDTGEEENLAIPDDNLDVETKNDYKDERKCLISDYFTTPGDKTLLTYTYSDSWEHLIAFEKILPASKRLSYPKTIAGKIACPPEECGGINAYHHMISVLKDPLHVEYDGWIEWLADRGYENYNPESYRVPRSKYYLVPT